MANSLHLLHCLCPVLGRRAVLQDMPISRQHEFLTQVNLAVSKYGRALMKSALFERETLCMWVKRDRAEQRAQTRHYSHLLHYQCRAAQVWCTHKNLQCNKYRDGLGRRDGLYIKSLCKFQWGEKKSYWLSFYEVRRIWCLSVTTFPLESLSSK